MRRILITIIILLTMSMDAYAQVNVPALFNQTVKPYLEKQGVNGAAVAIYYQGHEYFYTYGYANAEKKIPVTKDTIFDLASITKVFTTTMLATQVQAGKIQLNDPIVKYLSPLSKSKGLPIDQVKVVELATHTASFPRDMSGFKVGNSNTNSLMQGLQQWRAPYPIGTHYLYSNVSFGLLGDVVAGASAQNYLSLLNASVLQPLNMKHTLIYFNQSNQSLRAQGYGPTGAPSQMYMPGLLIGGKELRSSITDMMQFLKANLNVGPNTSLQQAMQLAQQPQFQVKPNFIMALGWQRITRDGHLYITKNGGNRGFSTFIGFSPDKKFGVVVLANRTGSKTQKLGWQILRLL